MDGILKWKDTVASHVDGAFDTVKSFVEKNKEVSTVVAWGVKWTSGLGAAIFGAYKAIPLVKATWHKAKSFRAEDDMKAFHNWKSNDSWKEFKTSLPLTLAVITGLTLTWAGASYVDERLAKRDEPKEEPKSESKPEPKKEESNKEPFGGQVESQVFAARFNHVDPNQQCLQKDSQPLPICTPSEKPIDWTGDAWKVLYGKENKAPDGFTETQLKAIGVGVTLTTAGLIALCKWPEQIKPVINEIINAG